MSTINKLKIAQSFGLAANTYDSAAHFQRWVGDKLITKIPKCAPETVIDLGCGTGHFSESLKLEFPYAQYVGMDLSEGMTRFAKKQHASQYQWVVADAESLPFKGDSVDLIYSSLAIQWCSDLSQLMKEVDRVLRPNGIFVFSTLVDGSLEELKVAWSGVDDKQHVNDFFVKESYQQAVLNTRLSISLLDEETKVLQYQQLTDLMRELKSLGAHNLNEARSVGLMGKKKLRSVISEYEPYRLENGCLPASYQILWGVLRKRIEA